MKMMNKKES